MTWRNYTAVPAVFTDPEHEHGQVRGVRTLSPPVTELVWRVDMLWFGVRGDQWAMVHKSDVRGMR